MSQNSRNQGFLLGDRIRFQEAHKYTDPTDPFPQH
jgi:hypothetical protein